MFGFFKNLMRRPVESPGMIDVEETAAPVAAEEEPMMAPSAPPPIPVARPVHRPAAPRQAPRPSGGAGVEISLQQVLNCLPLELQPRVRVNNVGDTSITIPLEKVLGQLSRGSVKIAFGELRSAAPEVFTSANDRDRVMVALPLSEILPRLNPALIQRRRIQKTVEVPEDIRSPFDETGMFFAVGSDAAASDTALKARQPAQKLPGSGIPARQVAPLAPKPAPPAAAPQAPNRISMTSAPTPPAPTFGTTPPITLSPGTGVFKKPFITPAVPPAGSPPPPAPTSIPFNRSAIAPAAAPAPAPIVPRQADPNNGNGHNGNGHGQPQAPAPEAKPVSKPTQSSSNKSQHEPIMVTLVSVAESWPEAVRREIVDWGLVEARVALPFDAVEQALKQGRIAFSWQTLRSWTVPAARQGDSPHDGTVMEVPLKLVAPLYLVRQRENNKHQQRVAVDDEIPNLFFGFPQPEQSAAVVRPTDSNFYVWDDGTEMLRADDCDTKRQPSVGTQFVAKYATPNEIVSRAASLDGVVGAIIALPDGLMVANKLPPELNGETIAAFLPQIFGKVSVCTKELRMGELNNLNFTVGNVPWKIYRVNAIFFAAFGRAGESLPTAQLAALAADLDHKPK